MKTSKRLEIAMGRLMVVWLFGWFGCVVFGQDSSALINQALDQQVKLDVNATLPGAMEAIGKQTGVRLQSEAAVWDLLPWGQETNIVAKIENQTLRQALTAITRKLGLTFVLKDEYVELQAMPALRRLGRRATVDELEALSQLAGAEIRLPSDRVTVKQVVDTVDGKLMELKSAFAVEFRAEKAVGPEQQVFVPRNASLMDALEALHKDTGATWYPWGKSIVVVGKEDQIRGQLAKTMSTRYVGTDIGQVLLELSQKAGVNFDIEPGALQRIPPEARVIRMTLSNVSIQQALETIAGFTGLGYVVREKGVYIWNQQNALPSVGTRQRIVGILQLPEIGVGVVLPESAVPADLRQYIEHKTQKELGKLRQMMKEEKFIPATQPGREDL